MYQGLLDYMFRYYSKRYHKYDVHHQDQFTDIFDSDVDKTNNTSESIDRGLKKIQTMEKYKFSLEL